MIFQLKLPFLVGGLEHVFMFPSIGNVIIPIDFHMFQRGDSTTKQMYMGCSIATFDYRRILKWWRYSRSIEIFVRGGNVKSRCISVNVYIANWKTTLLLMGKLTKFLWPCSMSQTIELSECIHWKAMENSCIYCIYSLATVIPPEDHPLMKWTVWTFFCGIVCIPRD